MAKRQISVGDTGANKRVLDYAQAFVYPQIESRRELIERILLDWENDRLRHSEQKATEKVEERLSAIEGSIESIKEALKVREVTRSKSE